MRNGWALWSNVVFKKEVICHWNIWIWFQDLWIRFWGLEIKHLKAHNFVWQVCSFIIILQLRPPIELKFSQVCYFIHVLSYTKWEDWSLTITNCVQCLLKLHSDHSRTKRVTRLPACWQSMCFYHVCSNQAAAATFP